MVESRRLNQLRGALTDRLRLPAEPLVIALSGGADSAALADLLAHLGAERRAVHVNHGLAASGDLEEAARAVAEQTNTTLDVVEIEVPAGASFEGQARNRRYEALLGSLEPEEVLLTAHTLDDQAETVLLNLLRGAGPAGMAGIPPRTGRVARPMLEVKRGETRELAGLAGLPYRDDPTNLDPGLRRNAVRLEVIPDLAARFNPRLVESLARTASLLQSDQDHLATEGASIPVVENGSGLALAIGGLLAVPRPVADRAIRGCLSRLRPPYSGTAAEMAEIWDVVSRRRAATVLAEGLEVTHEGPMVVFRVAGDRRGVNGPVALDVGRNQVDGFEILVDRHDGVCRVLPIGSWSAVFPDGVRLEARVDEAGRLMVAADEVTAWLPGERRLPVAWYQPGASGYLSVFAREDPGWT
jgi:tRNA(Ile)-lysidine synthase